MHRLIERADNQRCVFRRHDLEVAIKHPLQRFGGPFSGSDALGYFADTGNEWLDVAPAHATATESLPPLHADPFDRILSRRRSSNRCAC